MKTNEFPQTSSEADRQKDELAEARADQMTEAYKAFLKGKDALKEHLRQKIAENESRRPP